MEQVTQIGLFMTNEIAREGISHILMDRRFRVALSLSSIADFDADAMEEPEIVVLALGPSDDVGAACTELALACPSARRVLTAPDFGLDDMILAYEHGIDGLILSGASCDQFAGSLRLVALGERVLPGKVADYLAGRIAAERPASATHARATSGLSHREFDILGHLVDGDANKVIARRLNITEATVKVHVKTILRKLQLANRTQAAIWATRNQIGHSGVMMRNSLAQL
jgi:two-component system nitrate/nitrite response regulator NarL